MTWMLIRLVLSLAFVGLVLWFAARIAKKRGLGGANQGLIEVVARQRLGRSSTVNVVRIGDVVLVVGATEEQVTLLAEVDNETIDAGPSGQRPVRVAAPAPAAIASDPRPEYETAQPVRGGYEPGYEQGYDAGRYAGDGYADDYAESGYDDAGYRQGTPEPGYAGERYADRPGYADRGHDPAQERRVSERRAGGHHADGPRHGGAVRRPAAAPQASSGPLAGSVFDKNGWGTFVNELRERTVRRP